MSKQFTEVWSVHQVPYCSHRRTTGYELLSNLHAIRTHTVTITMAMVSEDGSSSLQADSQPWAPTDMGISKRALPPPRKYCKVVFVRQMLSKVSLVTARHSGGPRVKVRVSGYYYNNTPEWWTSGMADPRNGRPKSSP